MSHQPAIHQFPLLFSELHYNKAILKRLLQHNMEILLSHVNLHISVARAKCIVEPCVGCFANLISMSFTSRQDAEVTSLVANL